MQITAIALMTLLLPMAALAQDTTGQKLNHAPGRKSGTWPKAQSYPAAAAPWTSAVNHPTGLLVRAVSVSQSSLTHCVLDLPRSAGYTFGSNVAGECQPSRCLQLLVTAVTAYTYCYRKCAFVCASILY